MVITFNVKPDAVNDIVSTPEETPVTINMPSATIPILTVT